MITVNYAAAKALAEALGDQMPRCELTWTSNFSLSFIRHPVPGEYSAPTFSDLVRYVLPKLREKASDYPVCVNCGNPVVEEGGWCGSRSESAPIATVKAANKWHQFRLFEPLLAGGMEAVSAAVIELCKEVR